MKKTVNSQQSTVRSQGLKKTLPTTHYSLSTPPHERGAERPSWEEYFMRITEEVCKRSTCLRRQTGALIVKERRILSTGYNGAPRGLRHCAEAGCLRENLNIPSGERQELCRGLHAEQNAIIQAALHGIEIKGASLYTTHQPCILCAKMIINAGVKEIIYLKDYPDALAEKLLREAQIKLVQLSIDSRLKTED